jgi:membrane-bound metal-dependent hydrolase YbcI (DUF457 family)
MFNSTHTLVGLGLARAGFDRWTRHAAWTAVIAANLPDIDIVVGLYDNPAYIDYHRGITHAIAGIPLLSIVVAAAMYKFSGNFWRTFIVALAAMSTHPVLDYMNTYGLRPFLPFDGTWFYGDTLFIIDPIFDGVLIASRVAGHFIAKRRQQFAIAGLIVVTLYTGAQMHLRNLSRSYLTAFDKAAVSPLFVTPLAWIGLIDNPDDVSVVTIEPLRGVVSEPDRMMKAPMSEVVARAMETRSARSFHGFARFPVTTVTNRESGYTVRFIDVRYLRGDRAFAAIIQLDGSLQVVDELVGFDLPLN